jgi:predicted dehydrogenase
MLNVAIIGISGYGKYVLDAHLALAAEGLVHFLGATVAHPAKVPDACALLRGMGCELFGDYQQMLEKLSGKIDLCVIPTGIEWHLPMACAAMSHGAHVLVEKPLAGSVADGEEIIATSHRLNRRVAVGFQDLCSEPLLEAKRRMMQGDLGTVHRIRAMGIWPRDFSYYRRNAWVGCLRRGGKAVFDSPLNNAFAHLLNLALFFAGSEFAEVARPAAVDGRLFRTYPIESFDTGSIHVTTCRDIRIDCYVSHAGDREVPPRMVIEGERGRIEWLIDKTITLYGTDGEVKWSIPLNTGLELRTISARVTAQAIDRGEMLVNTAENALSHAMAIEKLHAGSVIQDVPKEKILQIGDGLVIASCENWLTESFEKGTPLSIS